MSIMPIMSNSTLQIARNVNECFICMEVKDVAPVRCLVTSLIHDGYMCCSECQRQWYRRSLRCVVCNRDLIIRRDELGLEITGSRRRRSMVYCCIVIIYAVIAYALLYMVVENVCVDCGYVEYPE